MKSGISPHPQVNYLFAAAWAIIFTALYLLALDSFIGKPDVDSSIYIYVAKGILEGELPYVDRWDHKGPLLYLLNLFGLLIHDTWGLWLVQGLFLLGASTFAFLALRKPFGTLPALFALALFLYFFASFAAPGNFTEQYGLLFQFLTLYLFLRSQEQPNPAPSQARFASLHLAIGALGAASFLLRPNLVALWIVIGLFWLVMRGSSLRKLAWAAVGGGSILILVAGLFIAIGAWSALWEAVFIFNFAHSDAPLQDRLRVVWDLSSRMDPISLLVIAGWCIGVFSFLRKRVHGNSFAGLLAVALISLPLEIMSLSLSGYSGLGFLHYYLTALPVVSLLLAFLVWFIEKERLATPTFLTAVLLIGVLSHSFSYSRFAELSAKYLREGVFVENRRSLLGDYIRAATEPDDRILVWGHDPRIYLFAERNAPTRYFYQSALVKPSYSKQSIRDEFLSDIKEETPKLIIDIRLPWYPPLSMVDRADWRPAHRYIHDPTIHTPFFDFVEANYTLVEIYENYLIYMLSPEETIEQPAELGDLIVRSLYDVYLNDRILTLVRDSCSQDDATRRFILHVIPVDNSVIDGKAESNMDFTFKPDDDWQAGDMCVVSQELPDYPIAFIRIGQYNLARTGHDWLEEFHFTKPN